MSSVLTVFIPMDERLWWRQVSISTCSGDKVARFLSAIAPASEKSLTWCWCGSDYHILPSQTGSENIKCCIIAVVELWKASSKLQILHFTLSSDFISKLAQTLERLFWVWLAIICVKIWVFNQLYLNIYNLQTDVTIAMMSFPVPKMFNFIVMGLLLIVTHNHLSIQHFATMQKLSNA